MRCNIRFYIFGVPDGFDIYLENQGDGNTKNYYQCFYDESIKEDIRFAIHRKVNGDVTYTYLKYHLISSGNRMNAFLGLSVLVEKGYYADVSSMYNLLDYAYGEMLKRELLLPTPNGLSAKFTIKTFEERKEDIKSIEAFVLNTLQSSDYVADFHPLDPTFTNEKTNACLKIPFQIYRNDVAKEKELNSLIVGKLKIYSWLSLSPNYQKKEQPPVLPGKTTSVVEYDEELNPETKQSYSKDYQKYQREILTAYEMLVNEQKNSGLMANVKELNESVREILKTLYDYYNKNQDDLKDLLDNYADIAKKLDTLISKLNEKVISSGDDSDDDSDKKREGGKWQRYAVAIGGLFVVCLLACFLYYGLRPNPMPVSPKEDSVAIADSGRVAEVADESSQKAEKGNQLEALVARFDDAIQADDWSAAIESYNQIFDEYADKNQSKIQECDSKLENEFGNLIKNNDFEAASEWRNISSETFRDSFLQKLRNAFKTYITSNKNNFSKKEELIAKINEAMKKGYEYEGVSTDLEHIEKLSQQSSSKIYKLAVFVENVDGGNKAIRNPKSTETIELEVGLKYRIRNMNVEANARFERPSTLTNVQCYPKNNANVQLKFAEGDENKEFEIPYKNKDQTFFTLKVKVVKKKKENETKRPRGHI